jgi:dUTP pyrophosphatase
MEIRYKKTNSRAMPPVRGTEHSAGMDLIAISKTITPKGIAYGTGLAFEIPENHVGLLFPRSSVSKTSLGMANSVGVIDSDYRGEITAVFKVTDKDADVYSIGDRVCQLVIVPIPSVELVEADDISNTERGHGGFGSTGK